MTPWVLVLVTLAREQMLAAQRVSLAEAGLDAAAAQITVKGASADVLAAATVRFPWTGLAKPAAPGGESVMMWRGEATGVDGAARPAWARVQITFRRTGIVATRPISAGRRIAAGDFRVSSWNAPLSQSKPLDKPEILTGAVLRRPVMAGAPILADMVASGDQILPGEKILVESIAGPARITFDATAENRASAGEPVFFRSPLNGKRVAGRAEPGHRVVVTWEN